MSHDLLTWKPYADGNGLHRSDAVILSSVEGGQHSGV